MEGNLYTVNRAERPRPVRLTPKQLAAELGVHYNTVLRWIALGMPRYRCARRGAMFVVYAECLDWLKNRGDAGEEE